MSRHKQRIVLTGGSGFVGQLLQDRLRRQGHTVDVFDQVRGASINLLRRRYLGTVGSQRKLRYAQRIKRVLARTERLLIRARVIQPSFDNILDLRSRLSDRFRGSDAVIHLAALPHPSVKGAIEADYRRLNWEGAVNAFEAARAAGVPKFIFPSSAQVYGINKPIRIDQFPILETNYCPTLAEGQSLYGRLKLEFEEYLQRACAGGGTQALALRLEFPGTLSKWPWNFFVSTSVENLLHGFGCALRSELPTGFDVFNLADGEVDPRIIDIQQFVQKKWPQVPNYTRGNESLMSTAKVRQTLGYQPKAGGTYLDSSLMW